MPTTRAMARKAPTKPEEIDIEITPARRKKLIRATSKVPGRIQCSMSTKSPPPRCYLLELPLELRLMIYEHTMHQITLDSQWSQRTLKLDYEPRTSAYRKPRVEHIMVLNAPRAALLRSCSTIRNEYEQFLGAFKVVSFCFDNDVGWMSRGFPFRKLDCYLEEFGLVSDTLVNKIHNLTVLILDFHVMPLMKTMSESSTCIMIQGRANGSF